MKELIQILLSVIIGAGGQILLKYGALKTNLAKEPGFIKYLNWPIMGGLILYAVSALIWIMVLKKVQLSYAYPMVSFGYVIVFVASLLLFNESVNLLRVIGLVLITAGIIFVARS